MFPHVQKKAQKEIDTVVGRSRLPTGADRESLPYVNAIVKEVLRMYPVAPIGKYLRFLMRGLVIKVVAKHCHMRLQKMIFMRDITSPRVPLYSGTPSKYALSLFANGVERLIVSCVV